MFVLKLLLVIAALGLIGLGVWIIIRKFLGGAKLLRYYEQKKYEVKRTYPAAQHEEVLAALDVEMKAKIPKLGLKVAVLCFIGAFVLLFLNSMMVDVPKKGWAEITRNFGGGSMNTSQYIATLGEDGPQAQMLTPGLKFVLPGMYSVKEVLEPFVVGDGQIGVVTTTDGQPMPDGMLFAPPWEDTGEFLNAHTFLTNGEGFKGEQVTVIKPGAWKPHTELYSIELADQFDVPIGHVLVVKANYGEAPKKRKTITIKELIEKETDLSEEELADAYTIAEEDERRRQLAAGVTKDKIEINRDALKVKRTKVQLVEQEKTITDPLVNVGQFGTWRKPFDPGKYALHPKAHEFILIDTRKQRLNYSVKEKAEGKSDDSRMWVRSLDGFDFPMEWRVVYHVESQDSPQVAATLGDDDKIPQKVITPAVRSVSRILAGRSKVLDLFRDLELKQREAYDLISKKCRVDGVTIDEVHIGRIGDEASLGELMRTQKDREIAVQEQVTFAVQREAAEQKKELNKTQQEAEEEKTLATAAYEVQRAENRKLQAKIDADASALKVTIAAEAEAKRLFTIKKAEADGYALKVAAIGKDQVALLEALQLVSDGQIKITPDVMVSGGGGGGSFEALMGTMLGKSTSTP